MIDRIFIGKADKVKKKKIVVIIKLSIVQFVSTSWFLQAGFDKLNQLYDT